MTGVEGKKAKSPRLRLHGKMRNYESSAKSPAKH